MHKVLYCTTGMHEQCGFQSLIIILGCVVNTGPRHSTRMQLLHDIVP